MMHRYWYLGLCGLLALTACGSSDDEAIVTSSSSSSSSSTVATSSSSSSVVDEAITISGLAAVGAPVVNASVVAKCSDGASFITPVTTSNQGHFQGHVQTGVLPCALQVSGGTPAVTLHSYTLTGGHVNITPLTDMTLANAINQLPIDWFTEPNWDDIENYIETSTEELLRALEEAGFAVPDTGASPFTLAFTIGDPWDQLLDSLQAAIDADANIDGYEAFVDLIQQGNLGIFSSLGNGPSTPSSSSSTSSSSSSSSSVSSVSSGGGNGESASVCFNPVLFEEGTHVVSEYRSTDGASGKTINFTYDQTVYGTTTFNGQSVRYTITDVEASGDAPSVSTSTAYFTVDADNHRSTAEGVKVEVIQPTPATTQTTNQPGRLTRYDLQVGESYSQSYTSSTQVMGFDLNTPVSFTHTFSGLETITVPAGTYESCRFDINEDGVASTRWFAVDSGIELRVLSDGDETVLLSADVNGNSL